MLFPLFWLVHEQSSDGFVGLHVHTMKAHCVRLFGVHMPPLFLQRAACMTGLIGYRYVSGAISAVADAITRARPVFLTTTLLLLYCTARVVTRPPLTNPAAQVGLRTPAARVVSACRMRHSHRRTLQRTAVWASVSATIVWFAWHCLLPESSMCRLEVERTSVIAALFLPCLACTWFTFRNNGGACIVMGSLFVRVLGVVPASLLALTFSLSGLCQIVIDSWWSVDVLQVVAHVSWCRIDGIPLPPQARRCRCE